MTRRRPGGAWRRRNEPPGRRWGTAASRLRSHDLPLTSPPHGKSCDRNDRGRQVARPGPARRRADPVSAEPSAPAATPPDYADAARMRSSACCRSSG
ncbi:hypothetical protein NS263_13325 [Curtobacterium oceanosedimentum]|uniref:Uncharacterized protein n=1 Tax=Curtobacterium oceanosedimentum TaxID=465820 RepID=A0ABR5S6J2_9MICO|nr:hypothetical protein NS263_13325 [Curtobacterium oceanosedimentum]